MQLLIDRIYDEKVSYIKKKLDDMDRLKLIVVSVGNNEASNAYIRNKERVANKLGIDFLRVNFKDDITEKKLIKHLELLQEDLEGGLIVQFPLPSHINENTIANVIRPEYDVDCISPELQGMILKNQTVILPATVQGVVDIIDNLRKDELIPIGDRIAIAGRSSLIGRPLMAELINKDYQPVVFHTKTANFGRNSKYYNVIVLATGQHGIVKDFDIPDDTFVIDCGYSFKNGKTVGDLEFTAFGEEINFHFTKTPGGTGRLTVINLFYNMIKLYENY